MKDFLRKAFFVSTCLLLIQGLSYGQWTNMVMYGSSYVSPGSTIRYTSTENVGTYYYWTVKGGKFSNGQTSIVQTGTWRFDAYVTWDACSGSSNRYVSVAVFNRWPPGSPVGAKSKNVNTNCYVPPVKTCSDYQNDINNAYTYAPGPYKCSSVMQIVSQAQNAGLNCSFYTHGCN